MDITFYDSVEDMFDDIGRASKAADARVTEAQKKYRPGDIVVSDSGYGFPVFHDLIDIERMVGENLQKHADYEDEGVYLLDLYREPHMENYCFSRSYSEACQDGEYGDVHRSVLLFKMPREAFEELKGKGFRLKGDPDG